MSGKHPYRDAISTVPPGTPRPKWSVMIPTYNCAAFLHETLESVLGQDLGPEMMQIEVVDDCSTQDDPAAAVAELGHGRVDFYRQPYNLGHIGNFNACLQRARGQLIHLLHGDDCVRDGFYSVMQRAFDANPDVGAAFCRYLSMDEHGHWQTIGPLEQDESGVLEQWLERIATGQRLQPPAMVVRRDVYEQLGGFDRRIRFYGEDWEMWVRIAAHYPVWYEVKPLAVYRVGSPSLTSRSLHTGENVADLRTVIAINKQVLPGDCAQILSQKAREACALAAIRRAGRMLHKGYLRYPWVQIVQALRCYISPEVFFRILAFAAQWALQTIKRMTYDGRSDSKSVA
jgi:Glycosyl transferase family 2